MGLEEPVEGDMIQAEYMWSQNTQGMAHAGGMLGRKMEKKCDWQNEIGSEEGTDLWIGWRAAWEMGLGHGYSGSYVSVI